MEKYDISNKLQEIIKQYYSTNNPDERDNLYIEIIKLTGKGLFIFLRSRKMTPEDTEDLIQSFLIYELPKLLKTYNVHKGRNFLNYCLYKANFLFLNAKKREKAEQLRYKPTDNQFVNEEGESFGIIPPDNKAYIKDVFIWEIRAFFQEMINQIENSNQRYTIYLKLLFPIQLSNEDCASILGIPVTTFKSTLYRALNTLKAIIRNNYSKYPIDLEDIRRVIIEQPLFYPSKDAVDQLPAGPYKDMVLELLEKKIQWTDLYQNENIDQNQLRDTLFKLIKKEKLILRKETNMDSINQEELFELLQVFESNLPIEDTQETLTQELKEKDPILFSILSILHQINSHAYQIENRNSLEYWTDLLQKNGMTLSDISEHFRIDFLTLNDVLSGYNQDKELIHSIKQYIKQKAGNKTVESKKESSASHLVLRSLPAWEKEWQQIEQKLVRATLAHLLEKE